MNNIVSPGLSWLLVSSICLICISCVPSIDVPVIGVLTSLLSEHHAKVYFVLYLLNIKLGTVQDLL